MMSLSRICLSGLPYDSMILDERKETYLIRAQLLPERCKSYCELDEKVAYN